MIVADTNLVSEPLRPSANAKVTTWLDRQIPDTLFLSSISLGELLLGVELLPPGRRRTALDESLHGLLLRLFGTRILHFDEAAAIAYAKVVSKARSAGCPISVPDAQIAAIALVQGYSVATRDERPFHAAGVSVINPWKA
jgi:predicted nucleic acid-binding protein